MSAKTEFKESLNLSEARRVDLAARLDELADRKAPFDRSGIQRQARHVLLPVTIHQPGGSMGKFLVPVGAIARAGAWFLHASFLHPGTECVFGSSVGGVGETDTACSGRVVLCEHVDREAHAVAVEFDEPMDIADVLSLTWSNPAGMSGAETGASAEAVAGKLRGTILHIEDQKMDGALLAHHLRSTEVTLLTAMCESEAIEKARSGRIDLVLCDLNLGEERGERVMEQLRRAGFTGPILMLTAERAPARLQEGKQVGAAAVIHKPYDARKLLRVLEMALNRRSAAEGEARGMSASPVGALPPVTSTLSGDPTMQPLIEQYVREVRQMVEEISDALASNDFAGVRTRCQNLKGTGQSFGFAVLGAAAQNAVKAMDSSGSVGEAKADLDRLCAIALRLSA